MPRMPTTDPHAELAVALYSQDLDGRGWELDHSWVAIARLLMTCEIWRNGEWQAFHDAPVLRESNDYRLNLDNQPNKALRDALEAKGRLAAAMQIDPGQVCGEIGQFFRQPGIVGLQPNNPRGHAFRSIVAATLDRFGDQELEMTEEVSPHDLFPGYDFGNRSADARIDIVVKRRNILVALISTRWTYRHDRVDLIDEARAYMPAALGQNGTCRFFGVVSEFGSARLSKVIEQTRPNMTNAAIDRLVHLNPELPRYFSPYNQYLENMWSLEQMVRDSENWR